MKERIKFFIALLLTAVVIISAYFIFKSQPKFDDMINQQPDKSEAIEEMEKNYKDEVKPIVADFQTAVNNQQVSVENILTLKNKLLGLKVPTKFKDLHVNLVFAMVKMENFLEKGDIAAKAESQQVLTQAKANYQWLSE